MKRAWAILLALVMLLGMMPAGIVSAAVTEYYPTTWEELKTALESSGDATVIIPEDVMIERTFDHHTESINDLKITVKEKKDT